MHYAYIGRDKSLATRRYKNERQARARRAHNPNPFSGRYMPRLLTIGLTMSNIAHG